jgi:ribosomal protein L21E
MSRVAAGCWRGLRLAQRLAEPGSNGNSSSRPEDRRRFQKEKRASKVTNVSAPRWRVVDSGVIEDVRIAPQMREGIPHRVARS